MGDYEGGFNPFVPRPGTLGGRDVKIEHFNNIEAYIVFNVKKAVATPLPPPADVRVYSLPGVGAFSGRLDIKDATNNAGLLWDLELNEEGVLLPNKPIMHNVWRASLGNAEVPTAPSGYELITQDQPVLVTRADTLGEVPPASPQRSKDWPPHRLHFLDTGLNEGWYGYQVSAMDIFGRRSANSLAARWHQWSPAPEPLPWYYREPPNDAIIHPSAVRLLDKMPPPPPTGIEAYALDPADPTLLKDEAYDNWWNSLPLTEDEKENLIGLRVRWQWTEAHNRQAPDTREFRIYYQPGQMNAAQGRTLGVSVLTGTESAVETDLPNTRPANAYVGASLRVGAHAFAILASDGASPLRLRVRNAGPVHHVETISVIQGSSTVTGTATGWRSDLAGMVLEVEGDAAAYTILAD